VNVIDLNAALLEQTRAFAQLVAGREMTTRVPTTPGWSLAELVKHVGHGHQWSAQIVARRAKDQTLDDYLNTPGASPADYTAESLLDWLPATAQALVNAVKEQGTETTVWTFLGPRQAEWWLRRRLHETTVHRADAAIALEANFELATDLAADGISEHLERIATQSGQEILTPQGPHFFVAPLDEGKALHLASTDHDARWTVVRDGTGVALTERHDSDATEVRGPVTDLLLILTRRCPIAETPIRIAGDAAVLLRFLDRTPY